MEEIKYMLEITAETRTPEHRYIKRSFPVEGKGQKILLSNFGYPYNKLDTVYITDFDEKEGRLRLECDRKGANVCLNGFTTTKWDNGYINSSMYHVPGDIEICVTYYLYIE
jgi:hypothetical protein